MNATPFEKIAGNVGTCVGRYWLMSDDASEDLIFKQPASSFPSQQVHLLYVAKFVMLSQCIYIHYRAKYVIIACSKFKDRVIQHLFKSRCSPKYSCNYTIYSK